MVRVSTAMFDVLWGLVLGEQARPAVLHTGSPGRQTDDRVRVVDAATAQLRAAGHLGPLGVADEMVAVLNTVGRPRLAVDAWIFEGVPVDDRHPLGIRAVGARVAVAGAAGVVVMLDQPDVMTWSFPPDSLVAEVIALFGEHEAPHRFAGLTVRPDQLRVLACRAANDPALRLLSGPYIRRAHAIAVAYDHDAGRARPPTGLTLNDTAAGRFLVYPDGNLLVVAPGDRATLERKLGAMTELR